MENKSYCDVDIKKRFECNNSRISSQFVDVNVFSNKKHQYKQMEKYAEFLGSAFQKINFLRDMCEDYHTLNRVYFPDLDIKEFDNTKKKIIEEDIAKDFANGLIGIKLLDKDAKKGVYLAYKYYIALFNKIQKTDANKILQKRIRVSNFKKILILITAQLELKLGL